MRTRKENMSTIRKSTIEALKRGREFRAVEVAEGLPPKRRLLANGRKYLDMSWDETHDNLSDLIEDAPNDQCVDLILEGFAVGYYEAVREETVTA